jgi:hypothetical protein
MTVAERQKQVVLEQDLAAHAGLWVALRDSYVIASALDAVTLRSQPEVDDDAVLMPVRRHGADTNVLLGHAISGLDALATSPDCRSDWPTNRPISAEIPHPRGVPPIYHI